MRLEVFEGPFDLLLHLISRRKLDVSDVGVAAITADFLAHLAELDELDLDTATRFLVVAATLIELKAVRLLPQEAQDTLEGLLGEARDVLYARLLEYRAFRQAAGALTQLLAANAGYHGRDVPLEPRFRQLAPPTPIGIDADGLARLAAVALAPRPEPHVDLSHVRQVHLSVRDAARQLLVLLQPGGATTFRDLVAGRSRSDRIAVFLALLELYKLGHIELRQPAAFGDLAVQRPESGSNEVDAVLAGVAAADGGEQATGSDGIA